MSLFIALSVLLSASFSGFDVDSISTLLHLADHEHGHSHTNEDDHSHTKELINPFSDLKVIHSHSNGHQHDHDNEKHEHTVNLGTLLIALNHQPTTTDLVISLPISLEADYSQNGFTAPYLDGLFRPPIG